MKKKTVKSKNRHKQQLKGSQSNSNSKQFQSETAAKGSTQPESSTGKQSRDKSSDTLLIGDSVLHGINPKGLKSIVYKQSVSGAKIDTVLSDIKRFDLNMFSSIIVYVGGNDVSSGTDLELFENKHDHLLNYIKKKRK